ncbi:replicative DNA helicase [Candidatus Photodesmus katoptron]|uniref:Replicative DNA helicase n=1 Tax=Candidatus Photodesmus katoptron Akat1 TaxID=1236703 RepID=S3DHR1_9GAMM|nr:replicative DNA helicase [Candidatus Photodesmus katoptron]EPE37987.1 replicative DNA helicase [Candidatus Photodesmus katoptron Akat1]KEY90227.1 replicative DNA helicase [Candidatus Photodesmus katoptron]
MANSKINNRNQKKTDFEIDAIKIPPHSLEAEQSVIGGLLLDNLRWDIVSEKLVIKDFYLHPHRLIFESIKSILEDGKPLDLVTLSEFLDRREQLEDVGGLAYLVDLVKNTPSAANINAYATIVSERALIRSLISLSHEIATAAYNPQGRTSEDLLDFVESKVFAIGEARTIENEGPQNVDSILEKTLEKIEILYKTPQDGVIGLSTGFSDLNKKTAGLQNAELIVVAARPSMGKTTFAMNICENIAMLQDKTVLIFSLEMPADQLMMRMLASLSRVAQTKIRTGQLNDEDWARISSTIAILMQKKNIYIDDSSGLTPTELRSRARRIARDSDGLAMIMIDYLQLMRVPSLQDSRTLEISEISRSLKALAKELNVPVVALSQLNRSLEQRADKRPINSDLRESGAIEQDADLIMFIYRDEVYNSKTSLKGVAEIIIGKQRNGPIGSVKLTFQGQFARFDNYMGFSFEDEQ